MIIAIDIGNSNVVFGINDGKGWIHTWRFPTLNEADSGLFYETQITDLLLEHNLLGTNIRQIIISSVVPDLKPVFQLLAQQLFSIEPVLISPELYSLFELRIDNPQEIGTDLLANAVAAHHTYKSDCIIVDFGTALTFTTLNAQGHILGVAIAPGLKTAITALFSKTAQLPEVPLNLPSSALGRNTVHAIQSGVLIGYVGLVEYLLQQIRAEVGNQYIAIATGGLSSILKPLESAFDHIVPHLTLDGIKRIGELVEGGKK